MRRARAALAGAGAAACALYSPLLAGGFPAYVAARLGMDPDLAAELTRSTRRRLGRVSYAARASAFAIATRRPLDRLVPTPLRRTAMVAFIRPLLARPPDRLAYALGRESRPSCGDVLPPA